PAPARPRHHPFHRWPFTYGRFLHHQTIHFEVGIVLSVRHRALQGLVYQRSRLLRAVRDDIERRRNWQALNLAGDFTRLERRNLRIDRKSTRLNSSHQIISYAVFCLKKKKKTLTKSQTATQYCTNTQIEDMYREIRSS